MAGFLGNTFRALTPSLFSGMIPGVSPPPAQPPPPVTPMGVAGASASGSWTEYFKNLAYVGTPVSWFVVLIFAGIIPVAPMSFLGYAGANLMISGSPGWAAAKAGVQVASYLAGQFLAAYFPELWFVSMILSYSPWYIFDIVQMFDPEFQYLGFRTPFFTKSLGSTFNPAAGTFGSITLIHVFVVILIMSLGGFTLVNMLPEEITRGFKPLLKTIFKAVAGITGLVGGGLAAFTAMPSMFSAMKGGAVQEGGSAVQEGGGKKTLDDIAKKMIGPDNSGAAYFFIGVLLTAALGGLALSSTRVE